MVCQSTKKIVPLAIILCLFRAINATNSLGTPSTVSTEAEDSDFEGGLSNEVTSKPSQMKMTLCRHRCKNDCILFQTPINKCFNGKSLFPDDSDVWGEYDVYDMVTIPSADDEESRNLRRRGEHTFKRYFFKTIDSSCGGNESVNVEMATDKYVLPLEKCVGPFGPPRPWGTFELMTADEAVSDLDIYENIE